ncbi:alpha-L-fucosidase 2 [Fusarium subglutinans]|uniref:Alpha-L-fucosidase 2 n=1 Tax=Gibberella subglutinans TaxID=42677 RepID=A0A8H5L9F3_GIBSU|nr:alpha-L-fucosidase 2 [Fusarium subglutinans]KAF5588809.1 alpha-L-fucosidase 2 [Fusarium subglutinans]
MYLFFLYVFVALVTSVGAQKGNYSGSRHLWYNTPGSDFRSSLPIGNGRLGALVQGSISEKIIINENSVWSGTFQDRVNPGSLEGFPKARRMLTENNYTGAAGREIVANFPLGVIAARFTASKKSSLSIGVSLQRDRGVISNVAIGGANNITMDVGGSGADAIPFTAGLRVVLYDDKAVKRGFESLKAEAISDHQNLMQRVDLDLGSNNSTSNQPTDKRVSAYFSNPNDDPEFVTLSFQFGRHLLVSSSRDTGGSGLGVPANLQGIWNDMYNPPWGSKFTVNINTEMNYWLAETTDLTDTLRPLWDLMYRSRDKGSQVATKMYGCPGYVSHHNLDFWGDSAPHDSGTAYTIWPSSNLWLSQHMMEHCRFTGDKTFLRQKAWPLFKDIASFFDCYLFRFNGQWTSGPSTSPENVFIIPKDGSKAGSKESLDISITMDNSLLREFFSNVIEAAGILGIDLSTDKVLSKVKGYRDGLRPTQIGARGQIQEWRKDYTEAEPGHRHYSHLVDLFPAKAMSPLLNKTLANAAQKSIELRLAAGGASTGWSRVWTAALYARLLNGEEAYGNIQTLLGRHPAPNLFHNIEPGQAFQIDSNFGLVAAVAETLVQSQAGVVHILPALGSQVKTGSVSGLVARGGFQVSIIWKDGLLVEAKVKSRLGNTLKVRVSGGSSFEIDGKGP